jgi:hypothetical protein
MASFTWTNNIGNGTWFDSGNWEPAGVGVPKNNDDVIIPEVASGGGPGPIDTPTIQLKSLQLGQCGMYNGQGVNVVTVSETFTWTGGALSGVGLTLPAQATGVVTVSADAIFGITPSLQGGPLTVSGQLTVNGPGGGQFWANEALITINGTLMLNGAGVAAGGINGVTVTNNGVIQVSGSCTIGNLVADFLHNQGSAITFASGGELIIGNTTTLHLLGGSISGQNGTLAAANFGVISVEAATTLPTGITLDLRTDGDLSPLSGTPVVLAPLLTVTDTLLWSGGRILGHLALAPTAKATVTSMSYPKSAGNLGISGGVIENQGKITFPSAVNFTLGDGALLDNDGHIVIDGATSLYHNGGDTPVIYNRRIVEKTSNGNAQLIGVTIENHGSVAIRAGNLALTQSGMLLAKDGQAWLVGGGITSDGFGIPLQFTGGTLGGVLRGHGTVNAMVENGGWIQPDGLIQLTHGYTQDENGNILLPSTSTTALVEINIPAGANTASLTGSLWVQG